MKKKYVTVLFSKKSVIQRKREREKKKELLSIITDRETRISTHACIQQLGEMLVRKLSLASKFKEMREHTVISS